VAFQNCLLLISAAQVPVIAGLDARDRYKNPDLGKLLGVIRLTSPFLIKFLGWLSAAETPLLPGPGHRAKSELAEDLSRDEQKEER